MKSSHEASSLAGDTVTEFPKLITEYRESHSHVLRKHISAQLLQRLFSRVEQRSLKKKKKKTAGKTRDSRERLSNSRRRICMYGSI